jgi:anti-sigma B factor antagonist
MHQRIHTSTTDVDGVSVVTLVGEVDLSVAEVVSEELQRVVRGGTGGVVIDCSGVSFMDSTGIHLLLNLLRRLTRQKRPLAIACPEGPVRYVLQLARLDGTFNLRDTREAAIHAARSGEGLVRWPTRQPGGSGN